MKRKDGRYIGQRMLIMQLPGKRRKGRPQRRFMDVVTEDVQRVGVTEEDARGRATWRQSIHQLDSRRN